MKTNKNERGSLTVEACLSFTVFMMIMFSLIFLIRIVYVYGLIQHAITQTAKELSSYSYLYQVSGISDIDKAITGSTSAGVDNFNAKTSAVVDAYSAFMSVGESVSSSGDISNIIENIDGTIADIDKMKDSFGTAADAVVDMVSNPVDTVKSIGAVFAKGVSENIKTFLGGEIVKYMAAEYIQSPKYSDANDRLLKLQVIGGINGLDFSSSKFFTDGADIDIVVCYSIKPLMPINILPELNLVNRVSVRGWGIGS